MSSKWYALRAVAGQEKKAKQYIESEIARNNIGHLVHQIVIPMEEVFEIRNGKKKSRERSFLPGYMLVQADLQAEIISIIKDVPGVIGFVGAEKGKEPIALRNSEVERILGKADEVKDQGEMMENPFVVGEQVKVMDGPFNGFDAVVEEVDLDKQKLKVIVKIFGRSTPLELKFLQVERIA